MYTEDGNQTEQAGRDNRLEATSEQRQRLIEAIFKRNAIRRNEGLLPLCIHRAYARGLNRILRHNLTSSAPVPNRCSEQPTHITADIIPLHGQVRDERSRHQALGQI